MTNLSSTLLNTKTFINTTKNIVAQDICEVAHVLEAKKTFLVIGGLIISVICAIGVCFMLVTHYLSKRKWKMDTKVYRDRGVELPRLFAKEVKLPMLKAQMHNSKMMNFI